MKNLIIVANFKSNLNKSSEEKFIEEFEKNYTEDHTKQVILCPSFISIPHFFSNFKGKFNKIAIGAQNVSNFGPGPFTGEVNASQLSDYCSYCIVGHSERRINYSEDLSQINDKVKNLQKNNINPIICISALEQLEGLENISEDTIFAYEPLSAIGSGNPSDPNDANEMAMKIRSKFNTKVLYGGSVNADNVSAMTSQENIDGVLVGEMSLDPHSFLQIIRNA